MWLLIEMHDAKQLYRLFQDDLDVCLDWKSELSIDENIEFKKNF